MRVTGKQIIGGVLIVSAAIGAYFVLPGQREPELKKPRNPVQVIKSAQAQQKSLAVTLETNGFVTAFNTVEVRPQTQNIVRTIHVKEGQEVRAGQLLFTLDQRADMTDVQRSQAQLARNRADLAEAEAVLKRNQELLAQNFVSQAVVDAARSRVQALRAAVQADQAAIEASQIELGNNKISASMSGRLGAITVHPGSLVQPSGTALVTIAQLDPISVTFAVPERELADIRTTYPDGKAPVTARLANGREVKGELFFIDNSTDQQTGTIRMKARFANQNRLMWPGSYATVQLVTRILPDAVVIPAQAIVTGPVDKLVYVVGPDQTVSPHKIQLQAIQQGQAAVTGLAPDTRIVVEGMQNLRPGSKVREAGPANENASPSPDKRTKKEAG